MRILHIVQRYYPCAGGSESYVHELSERLARAGDTVEVWTTDAWDPRLSLVANGAPRGDGRRCVVDVLTDRIARLLKDPDLARRFGEAGRAKVLAAHTWDQKIGKITSLYEDLVGALPDRASRRDTPEPPHA